MSSNFRTPDRTDARMSDFAGTTLRDMRNAMAGFDRFCASHYRARR